MEENVTYLRFDRDWSKISSKVGLTWKRLGFHRKEWTGPGKDETAKREGSGRDQRHAKFNGKGGEWQTAKTRLSD